MAETMRRSSLSETAMQGVVNLERAMAADGRFGGHMVSGHIDGTGKITAICREENAVWYTLQAEERLLHYIVEKGSVALDGISLTVANAGSQEGSIVNIECDVVGKYVEKFLLEKKQEKPKSRVSESFLTEHGFL